VCGSKLKIKCFANNQSVWDTVREETGKDTEKEEKKEKKEKPTYPKGENTLRLAEHLHDMKFLHSESPLQGNNT